jgi:pimeloyl-ACP methyl ester carboxylesterase
MRHANLVRTALVLIVLSLVAMAAGQPRPTESGFIQVEPDVRLFYQRFGTGTPVLFSPMRIEMVVTLAPLLERIDAVLWDARGFGLSDRPDDFDRVGLSYELSDAETIREHFGADRVYYLGGSLWGPTAMLYAARHPSSVAGAIAMAPFAIEAGLMGPPDHPIVHDVSDAAAELEAMRADGRDRTMAYEFCVLDMQVGFADSYVDLSNFALLEAANWCQYENMHPDNVLPLVFEGLIGSWGDWNWREELGATQPPVLLLYGDHEAWALEGVRAYAEVVPNIGWREFEDVGHHVWNERNDEVVAMIETFLTGAWPAGVERR